MTTFILDASVAIAWYLPEAFADAARSWRSRLAEGHTQFLVPKLHYWEFANVLRTNVRRNLLDPRLATEIWRGHLNASLRVVDPTPDGVLATALEYGTSAYDAVYIALAIELDIQLLTAERNTTEWVTKLGTRAISVAALPS
jgi:predicted nucleic acid-binding protein